MRPVALHGINSARALSCLVILLYHVFVHLNSNGRALAFSFPPTPGFHLFIVISGFMLVYTSRASDTPARFITRRLSRLVPLYWILTALTIVLATWHAWLFPAIDLSPHAIASSFFFLPDANLEGVIQPNLFTGWTLNYVVLSYILFAIATFAPSEYRPYVAFGLLTGFMLLANFAPDADERRFWTDPIQLELVGGMAAAVLVRNEKVMQGIGKRNMWPLILVSLVALIVSAKMNAPPLARAIACSVTGGLMVFGLAVRDIARAATREGPLQKIAQLGYSIYLIHPIVIAVASIAIIGRLGVPVLEEVALLVTSLVVTFALAAVTMPLIEKRLGNWIDGKVNRLLAARKHRAEPVN